MIETPVCFFQVRIEKDNELAEIARELTMLQSNMLKDQKRLECVIAEKQALIEAQAAESDRLRKQNKKLQQQLHSLQSKSKLMALHSQRADHQLSDHAMDTPSSETDSSPKSSFSTKSTSHCGCSLLNLAEICVMGLMTCRI